MIDRSEGPTYETHMSQIKATGKLVCEQQVLNELVVDRGPSPYVTQLELYGDGSC